MISIFYILAIISLAVGTAAIYMALLSIFPVKWLYYHYFIRKPIVWTIFIGSIVYDIFIIINSHSFPYWSIAPLLLMAFAVVLTYKMHQENAFKAVDFPTMTENISNLPIKDDMQLGVIEYNGITKAYPLDYVVHHHIINDKFGESIISLTYCAMCRSIIPFDVTDIGPLFVGSFKNANMIVADRRTKTFFQQASFDSIIGKLHPHRLDMIPFQIISWKELKKISPLPLVVNVTSEDFKKFELPIPGIWKKIVASEATPGLKDEEKDKTFPARTHVVGVIDDIANPKVVYLKKELLAHTLVKNEDLNIIIIALDDFVLAFKNYIGNHILDIELTLDHKLFDKTTKTHWNLRGKYIEGELNTDLHLVALSDEYWFSWKKFHENSRLIRI
jgi:hypothetical protein